jgi:hypothetical protein
MRRFRAWIHARVNSYETILNSQIGKRASNASSIFRGSYNL